ncbi:glycoside hydrolase family 16 protein [Mycolicibacterium baixiangningiae]|uniref:glycoside hydrolase family 16 protein n=1 Tax=Mycolicibacterium baixiangningiae TaxID=2761578 RepID=UPI0018677E44|nr:glycoside hydrolase family 16 protein [Mycolicibacterium baixiangningiae]
MHSFERPEMLQRCMSVVIVTVLLIVIGTGSLPSVSSAPDEGEWALIFRDDFDKAAPLGSWANDCDAGRVVYRGQQGQQWLTYPRCFTDTAEGRPYRADEVLSVGDGYLRFHLDSVDGQPAGANPSPIIKDGSQYQLYGRYSARMRVDTPTMSEYYVAWLLWPQSERWPADGELDFPEGYLDGTVNGFQHYAGSGACRDCAKHVDTGAQFIDWHVYTIEWSPGRVRYLLDGAVVLDSTEWVPTTPMRWQLQTETRGDGDNRGQLLVDWVSVWSYVG